MEREEAKNKIKGMKETREYRKGFIDGYCKAIKDIKKIKKKNKWIRRVVFFLGLASAILYIGFGIAIKLLCRYWGIMC